MSCGVWQVVTISVAKFSFSWCKEEMNGTESNTVPASESEEMKNDSGTKSEDDGDSGVVADTNQEALGPKVSATDNVTTVDTVPTVVLAEESDELMADETELAIVSDKKTQASSPQESDNDEWSDYEISEIDEKSLRAGEKIDSESEESSVSDKKSPASSSVLAGKETKRSESCC
ncbi:hypothetical protein Bca4012_066065 [Brassica carinata]